MKKTGLFKLTLSTGLGLLGLLIGMVMVVATGTANATAPSNVGTLNTRGYASFLGGANDYDAANGVATDSSGNVYIVSNSSSSDFPVTAGAYQVPNPSHRAGAGVTKINAAGQIVWSAFLVDNSASAYNLYVQQHTIAVNQNGEVYVAGEATGGGYPTTSNAYQSTVTGGHDIYLFKLSADGSTLLYGSYFGGTSSEYPNSLNVGPTGEVVIGGTTYSADFPITSGAMQATNTGSGAGFVIKLSATDQVVYSTYLGDSNSRVFDAVLNSAGQALVAGYTQSSAFPTTAGAPYPTAPGAPSNLDGFLVRLNSAGTGLVFSTYLGGSGNDYVTNIKENSTGIYVISNSDSGDFPVAGGGASCAGGISGAVLTHLSLDGSTLISSNCFIGRNASNTPTNIYPDALEISASGQAWIGVISDETLYQGIFNPAQSLYTPEHATGTEISYLFQVNSDGLTVPFGTFVDGVSNSADVSTKNIDITGLKLDSSGNLWVAVSEVGAVLATTSDAIQTIAQRGGGDGYVVKLTTAPVVVAGGGGGGALSLLFLLPLGLLGGFKRARRLI